VSEPRVSESRVAKAANLFDLRRIIGGVFVVLGILLAILGAFESQKEIDRAAGVNINLWTGLAMLVFGILMITWALTRPLGDELVEGDSLSESAPPSGIDAAALASHQRGPRPRPDGDRTGWGVDPRPK
jgi:drug/metabolite transporter (DMT)-like permease